MKDNQSAEFRRIGQELAQLGLTVCTAKEVAAKDARLAAAAEMIEKATPKAVRFQTAEEPAQMDTGVIFGKGVPIGLCPACGMFTTPSHAYCGKCGQRLLWPRAKNSKEEQQ